MKFVSHKLKFVKPNSSILSLTIFHVSLTRLIVYTTLAIFCSSFCVLEQLCSRFRLNGICNWFKVIDFTAIKEFIWTPQQPKASLAGHQQLLLLRICLNNIAKPKLQLLQPAMLLRICVEQHCKSKASYCNQQCSWGSVLNNIAKPKLPLQSANSFCRGSVWTTLQNRSLILQPAKMLRICVEQHSKTKAAASIAINNPFLRICFGTT